MAAVKRREYINPDVVAMRAILVECLNNSKFVKHYKRAESLKCHEPWPQAVRISDEIQTHAWSAGSRFIPLMTVLRRYNTGSGFCLDGNERSVRGPVDTEDVELTFLVVYAANTVCRLKRQTFL